jgi:hypothetical protein
MEVEGATFLKDKLQFDARGIFWWDTSAGDGLDQC